MSAKKFVIVCYNEELLVDYLDKNREYIKEYAYIKHLAEEEDKVDHIHLFLEFKDPKNRKPIANALNINEILIQSCKSKKSLYRYFLHKDFPNKIQYNINEIITNIDLNVLHCLIESDVETEEEYLQQQINFIDNGLKLTDLIRISIEDKNLAQLRRYWNIIKYFYENTERF